MKMRTWKFLKYNHMSPSQIHPLATTATMHYLHYFILINVQIYKIKSQIIIFKYGCEQFAAPSISNVQYSL